MDFKRVLFLVMLSFMIIPLVSSAEFDNVKSYDEQLKVVTITNAFGLGEVLGQSKLITPQNVRVGLGYQKVAEFNISSYTDYDDILKEFTFTDMKTGKATERDIDIKFRSYEDVVVDDYKEVCDDGVLLKNGTTICEHIIIGSHTEKREVWLDKPIVNLKTSETIRIGLYTDVKKGDYIDWIPVIYGVKIDEWATWTADLNNQIVSSFSYNDSSLADGLGLYALTNYGNSVYTASGFIQGGRTYDGSGDYQSNTAVTSFSGTSVSYSVWIKLNVASNTGYAHIVDMRNNNANTDMTLLRYSTAGFNFCIRTAYAWKCATDNTARSANSWYHLAGTYNRDTSEIKIYLNGSLINTTSSVSAPTYTTATYWIGRNSEETTNCVNGTLDDITIYNRTLSSDDINNIFLAGSDGYGYSVPSGVSPKVYLISPTNNSNLTSLNVNFIANTTDDKYVQNVSLKVDNIIVETATTHVNGTYTFSRTLTEGYHNWSILAYDNESLSNQSGTWFFNITILSPTINLLSPDNDLYTTTRSHTFIGRVFDNNAVANVTFLANSVPIQTNSSGVNDTNYSFSYTFPSDGDHTWSFSACDSNNDCSLSTRNIHIDTISPIINITQPQDQTYGETNITLNLNWTIVETNIDSCWYNYNGINTSVVCSSNGTTFLAPNYETKTITLYVNDTYGHLSTDVQTWDYVTFLNAIGYNAVVYETASEIISLNLSYNPSDIAVTGILEYDGVNYTSTKSVNDGGAFFSRVFDIPIGADGESKPLRWWMIVTGDYSGTSVTETKNQTISEIFLGLCNASSYNVSGINLTFYDEDSGLRLNTTEYPATFEGTFDYWVGTGDSYKNFSLSQFNQTNSSYAFCIFPYNDVTARIKTDLDLSYGAYSYSDNSYYLRNATLTNNTNFINLWLLPNSVGTKFFITAFYGINSLDDATITATKYFDGEGVYKTTGISQTDSGGKFTQYLDPDKSYIFYAVKDGVSYGAVSKGAFCEASPCELTLQFVEEGGNIYESYNNVYAGSVSYLLFYNTTSKSFESNFVDLTGTANYFRLEVKRVSLNNTDITICDTTLYTTAGSISCNMSGYTGTFQAKLVISRSPEKVIDIIQHVIGSLADSLGVVGLIVSLIIIVVLVFAGLKNPVVAVGLIPVALTGLKLMEFLAISWLWIGGVTAVCILIIGRLKT